jgi:AraC-like DNA-binding protein
MLNSTALSRAAVLDGFAAVARAAGLDPLALLARRNLPVAGLTDPELRVPAASVLSLLEDAAHEASMPDFGLAMADVRGFATLGAVGLAMREQPDLRHALNWLTHFGWVQTESVELSLEEGDGIAILDVALAAGMPHPAVQSIELSLASVARLIKSLLGAGWNPDMVLCSHARPASAMPYLRHFGQAPVFGAQRNALVIRTSDLDRPISGADPAMARELERYVGRIAGVRSQTLSQRVQGLIEHLLPGGTCRIERVARTLDVDRRTIHRRLAQEGTTFSALLDQTRRRLLSGYQDSAARSQTEIAELLGFSSLSAFSRWKRGRRAE